MDILRAKQSGEKRIQGKRVNEGNHVIVNRVRKILGLIEVSRQDENI